MSLQQIPAHLTPWSSALFSFLPRFIQEQLVLEREAHGTVQLSQVLTHFSWKKTLKKFNKSVPPHFICGTLYHLFLSPYTKSLQIETEKLLAYLVEEELKKRKAEGSYKGSFSPVCSFFGYFPTLLLSMPSLQYMIVNIK